jgi:hypothetical protein
LRSRPFPGLCYRLPGGSGLLGKSLASSNSVLSKLYAKYMTTYVTGKRCVGKLPPKPHLEL